MECILSDQSAVTIFPRKYIVNVRTTLVLKPLALLQPSVTTKAKTLHHSMAISHSPQQVMGELDLIFEINCKYKITPPIRKNTLVA